MRTTIFFNLNSCLSRWTQMQLNHSVLNILFCFCLFACIRASSLSDAYSAALVEVQSNGVYDQLHLKYFGTNASTPYPTCLKYYPVTPLADLKKVLEKGTVRHGIAILGPPYSFFQGSNLVGFDAELGLALTERVRLHYQLPQLKHVFVLSAGIPSILAELNANLFDIALADLSIDAGRSDVADFTCTYLPVKFGLLRSTLEPNLQLTDLSQVNSPSVKVVTFVNSFLEGLVNNFLPLSTKVPAANPPQILSLISNNTGHVAALPLPFITSYLTSPTACPGCSLLPFLFPLTSFRGIATRKQIPCNVVSYKDSVRNASTAGVKSPKGGLTYGYFHFSSPKCGLTEQKWFHCSFNRTNNFSPLKRVDLLLELSEITNPSSSDFVKLLNPSIYSNGLVNTTEWKVYNAQGMVKLLDFDMWMRVDGIIQIGKGANNNNVEHGGLYGALSMTRNDELILSLDEL